MQGLSWSVWDLWYLLWQAGSLAAARELLAVVCGLVSPPGIQLRPLQWECVLDTGPPQGSHYIVILFYETCEKLAYFHYVHFLTCIILSCTKIYFHSNRSCPSHQRCPNLQTSKSMV